ncbi:MAG: Uma2 family endonuclease [Spirochaetes bacterium]|nr:Uma2 family endonuclease [Spirochaetota bacterium]MBU0953947.1 Uma2 family endonuclease [Spirochaetota bacterium]
MAERHQTSGSSALKAGEKFTLEDWHKWPEGERWELINGEAWNMSPAPGREHQKLVGRLHAAIYGFLENKPCEVYVAPTDVFLAVDDESESRDTVVQPDLLVVCDPDKLVDEGIRGAPDLVIEVLSPSTAAKDLEDKKALYEKHGVREYWIVRSDGSVFVWVLEAARYRPVTEYLPEMPVPSSVLPGFSWEPRGTVPGSGDS